jgi:hypothetical protein
MDWGGSNLWQSPESRIKTAAPLGGGGGGAGPPCRSFAAAALLGGIFREVLASSALQRALREADGLGPALEQSYRRVAVDVLGLDWDRGDDALAPAVAGAAWAVLSVFEHARRGARMACRAHVARSSPGRLPSRGGGPPSPSAGRRSQASFPANQGHL